MNAQNFEIVEIRNICELIAQVYRDKMADADYDKNGLLYNFTWVTEYNNLLFLLFFVLPEYWYYAENGRGPGKFPPFDAILKWINFKKIVPRAGRNGKVPSTKQLVYLISRKIALEGTEGKHLLELTIDETYNTLVDKLVDAIIELFEKEIENEIDEI